MYELLDRIDSPSDIRSYNMTQLRQLCSELRSYIIECCSQSPGHLASSLGAVELIVGMHYVFDTPIDKLVFDVGHQAYAHKILTGRRDAFKRLRCEGGPSGFPRMAESEYDSFGVGHSSTSISAALGLTYAAKMQGRMEKVVALIGDGAMSGGLALEGLNNAGIANADILVLLNDNNQSIDHNTGALHEHLLKMSSSRYYNRLKNGIWDILGDHSFRGFVQRWVRSLKSWAVKKTGGDIFEALGFRYFGPINANDIDEVVRYLKRIKNIHGPRIIHCLTLKGKGFPQAEADPVTWHAPGKFNPHTGERISTGHDRDRYQDVFGQTLCQLASQDIKIVGVTPAMAQGSGMVSFSQLFPDRFFDVGIEEEHAVTFSAGLAAGGIKPFCNIYSSFSQRAYDQIIHDIALQNLPVVLCFDRAGLVGEDGATHHGVFDLAAYRSIPNSIVCSPKNELELKQLMYTASLTKSGPYIIRYPRGMGEGVKWSSEEFCAIEVGSAEELLRGSEVAIVAIGPVVNRAVEAASSFAGKVGVYNFRFLKPLDYSMLETIACRYTHIITVEDACLKGGLYGAVCEWAAGKISVEGIGVADEFVHHARQSSQLAEFGINREGIEKRLKKVFEAKK